VSELQEEVIRA
jgi:hypothetical protein